MGKIYGKCWWNKLHPRPLFILVMLSLWLFFKNSMDQFWPFLDILPPRVLCNKCHCLWTLMLLWKNSHEWSVSSLGFKMGLQFVSMFQWRGWYSEAYDYIPSIIATRKKIISDPPRTQGSTFIGTYSVKAPRTTLFQRHQRIQMQSAYLHFEHPNILHTLDEL